MIQSDAEGFTQLALTQSGDERLYVVFTLHPVQDPERTAAEGRPIFMDAEYVQIQAPGDRDVIHRPATDRDRQRFPKQYAAFKAGTAEAVIGTPLSAVPWLTRAQVEELGYFGVKSVEQLAGMADAHAQRFTGIQALKARAKDFLAAAAGEAPALKLRAELAERDNEIASLKRQLQEQAEAIAEIKRKKG